MSSAPLLFPDNSMAVFSDDRKYRYALLRSWDASKPLVMFVGLNPSTANEQENDPTIRRVISFAQKFGYGGVYMANLFALVTPYPKELKAAEDPLGANDFHLPKIEKECNAIIYCYGAFAEGRERAKKVLELLGPGYCLGINADGSPKHPLYLKSDSILQLYPQI